MLSTSAKVSLASNAIAWCALALAWHGIPAVPPLGHPTHKLLHVTGVILMVGNLVVGPLWLAAAFWERDRRHLALAARTLALADIVLTAPGTQLAVWNGIALAATFGGIRAQPWLLQAVTCVALASLYGSTAVLYAQERFVRAAQGDDEGEMRRWLVHWSIHGTAVGIPLGIAFWLMFRKEGLF